MNHETLIWVKAEDIYEGGRFVGTAPGFYTVCTGKKELEYWLANGGSISDNWEEYNRSQYFADGGDY